MGAYGRCTALPPHGPVAQWLEPAAHNGLVGGSSPPGPTTHSFELGIFPLCAKGPELAGCAAGAVVSVETNSGVEEISAALSLALKSRFLETETVSGGDTLRMW
jgi:hypothetical protein